MSVTELSVRPGSVGGSLQLAIVHRHGLIIIQIHRRLRQIIHNSSLLGVISEISFLDDEWAERRYLVPAVFR